MVIIPTINITEESLKEIEEMEKMEGLGIGSEPIKAQIEERDTMFFTVDALADCLEYKGKLSIFSGGIEWVTNWSRKEVMDAMADSGHIIYSQEI